MTTATPDYRVELDAYAGPLDLLLYLVKRHEIDLHDIPIARLTDQYLHHLEVIKHIDIERAGEFLVMASTLLEIKSAMLMPRPEAREEAENDEAETDPTDPRYELVQQLLAYKRFKDRARELESRFEQWQDRYPNLPSKARRQTPTDEAADDDETTAEAADVDLDDANVMELVEAFIRLMESVGRGPARHEVVYDETPIALHAEDIVDRLERDGVQGSMSLQAMFVGRAGRSEMIGLFLATLELVRQRRVRVQQDDTGEINLVLRDDDPFGSPDEEQTAERWRDPETGEMVYDFPTEQTRKRWQRRQKLRATLAKKKAAGEAAELDAADLDDADLDAEDLDDEELGGDAMADDNIEGSLDDDDEADWDDDEDDEEDEDEDWEDEEDDEDEDD